MNDAYTKESATLSEAIIAYGTLDPYDPARVQVVNVSPACLSALLTVVALHAVEWSTVLCTFSCYSCPLQLLVFAHSQHDPVLCPQHISWLKKQIQ